MLDLEMDVNGRFFWWSADRNCVIGKSACNIYLIHRAMFSTMNQLLAYLTQNCCGGQPCELLPVG
jgi:hypothetical protein